MLCRAVSERSNAWPYVLRPEGNRLSLPAQGVLCCAVRAGVSGRDQEDVATLLTSSWRKMRSLVLQKRNVQEFQFRQYLFAAQVRLSLLNPLRCPVYMYCMFTKNRRSGLHARCTCVRLVMAPHQHRLTDLLSALCG
jgi:hypothetical protein